MAEILSEFGHLVGLAGGNNIQATTMPTYSSVPLGTIVQYIGTTTADYINGYFYKATATGWEQHDTQPASNADNSITAFKESSPTQAAHAVDEYIRYNNVTYIVTAAIAIGDALTIGTNIAVPTLDEGTVIYTPEAGGGSVISADMVGYDNTTSELEATNVQDAIDKVVDIVADKVDKVTSPTSGNLAGLDANGNLTDVGWNANKTISNATGNPISISGLKSNQLAKDPIITLEPIQDLHGQSMPYPAGGGKNLIPLTVEIIKDRNQNGTWSGDTFTPSGSSGTITIITDAANNVTGFKINGTFSSETTFYLFGGWFGLSKGISYIINGGSIPVSVRITDNVTNTYDDSSGAGATFTLGNDFGTPVGFLYIHTGTWSNVISKPMICLATETDATFAPYENICPISGYDSIKILSTGKNLYDKNAQNTSNGFVDSYCLIADGTLVSQGNLVCVSEYISLKPNTGYFLNGVMGGNYSICFYKSNKDFVSGIAYNDVGYVSFETTSEMQLCRITVWKEAENSIQLEEGQTATIYEPYNKSTSISESLGQTVYGGTLDLRSGKLTVDKGISLLKDMSWTYADGLFCSMTLAGIAKNPVPGGRYSKSNKYNGIITSSSWRIDNYQMLLGALEYSTATWLLIRDDRFNNTTDYINSLGNDDVVCYELATPFTIQLTPHEISLLKDYAYVSTNGTNMSFSYKNGEMASLGDVAQLGQTVNELGDMFVYREFTRTVDTFGLAEIPASLDYIPVCVVADGYWIDSIQGDFVNVVWHLRVSNYQGVNVSDTPTIRVKCLYYKIG